MIVLYRTERLVAGGKMRNLYKFVKMFIASHHKQSILYNLIILTISAIATVWSNLEFKIIVALPFCFVIPALLRIQSYRVGHISFFSIDSLWRSYRLKYSGEELENKYKEASLKRATICSILALFSFVLWGIVEIFNVLIA